MKNRNSKFNVPRSAKLAAMFAIVATWLSIPYLTSAVKASSELPLVVRTSVLASPSGSINPHGTASWTLYTGNNREIEVEIEDVSIAAGTSLNVFVDGASIGTLVTDTRNRGKLKLSTQDGQTVPTTNDGSTVEVRQGSTVLVSGVFGGGGPTPTPTATPTGTPTGSPTPTPTGTPGEFELFANLTGSTLNGVLPLGFGKFEIEGVNQEFEARLRQINLPAGTVLTVLVDGTSVGSITIQNNEGRLKLETDNGQTVPAITAGSTIAVKNGTATILSGTFVGEVGPTPTPTPTGTPGPSPSPTPVMGRSFEAHLKGAGVTPPVTTTAIGEVKATLSADETQITVFGEFHGLSSAQTAARIESTVGTTTTIRDLGVVGGVNGHFASVTFAVTAIQVQQLRAGLWSAVIASANNPTGEIRGSLTTHSSDGDFDGDGNHDFAVFRPTAGAWYSQNSNGFSAMTFGSAADTIVSGDFDGDGKTDAAVYRNAAGQGMWDIKRSSDAGLTTIAFGLATDKPVRGDFDGDGRLDVAVYRPSNGVWYIQNSNNAGVSYIPFGIAEDKPMPADMDGDGRDDIVVFRPSSGDWFWLRSSDGQFRAVHFGQAGDVPVRGDFDGDGRSDVAVFRPSNGVWYILKSSDGTFYGVGFGLNGDIPVAGNYDGDGKTDITVFRPSTGMWFVLRSVDGSFQALQFGLNGDVPVSSR